MKSHYLFPGQYVVYREPCLVTTILGSCVAIVLFDPVRRIGAVNHYLLPEPTTAAGEASLRYGSVSFAQMLHSMQEAGADLQRLQAKIYGGARVLDNLNLGESIGKQNIDFATRVLAAHRIPVSGQETGGTAGRKIIFNTTDFSVEHQLMNDRTSVSLSGTSSALLRRSVRAVVVDDSAAVRTIFSRVLTQSGKIEVVAVARDAFEAREVIVKHSPDVVLLDIEMPGMSGVKFLEKLMQHFPIPTIMVSSLNPDDDAAVRALELGALEFVHKPDQYDPNTLRFFAENLVQKVIAAASSADRVGKSVRVASQPRATAAQNATRAGEGIHTILVGGNGGAHNELAVLLKSLPRDTPPVLVAVSSVAAHLNVFVNKWKNTCGLQLRPAEDGLMPMRGTVYFAPADQHLSLESSAGKIVMRLRAKPPVCLQIPSSEVLFESSAQAFSKSACAGVIAILLGGFGSDGVQGLLKLRDAGVRTVVIHPDASSFAFVPQAAIAAGAADDVMFPEEMAAALMRLRSKAAV